MFLKTKAVPQSRNATAVFGTIRGKLGSGDFKNPMSPAQPARKPRDIIITAIAENCVMRCRLSFNAIKETMMGWGNGFSVKAALMQASRMNRFQARPSIKHHITVRLNIVKHILPTIFPTAP